MLLSEIIAQLEALGHTEIKFTSNRFGQLFINSTETTKDGTTVYHSWKLVKGVLEHLAQSVY